MGWGRELFARLKEFLQKNGYRSLLVWVLEGNSAEHFINIWAARNGDEKKL